MSWLARFAHGVAAAVQLALFLAAAVTFAVATVSYQLGTGRQGRPPWWLLVLAAVAAAIILSELRAPLRAWVERRVFGREATGLQLMAEFMTRMAATLDIDDVLPRLAETAARSAHRTRGEVSVRLSDGREWREDWPVVLTTPLADSPADISVEVQHHGDVVGRIGVGGGGLSDADEQILGELAAPAGVALATVRLTVELRQRVEELAAVATELRSCQTRIVAARSAERHRIQDRVDATVSPHLAEADRAMERLLVSLGAGTAVVDAQSARDQLAEALDALRGVARGIFPALLSQAGIEAALRSLVLGRVPPVNVQRTGDLGALRSNPAAETALYFACAAALEPQPGPAQIALSALDDRVELTVSWTEPHDALAPATRQAIADRFGALGGALENRDDVDMTAMVVWLPMAAAPDHNAARA